MIRKFTHLCLCLLVFSSCFEKNVPVADVASEGYLTEWILMGPFPSEEMGQRDSSGANRSGFNTDFLEEIGGEEEAVVHAGIETTILKSNGEKRHVKAKRIGLKLEDPRRPDFLRLINNNQNILDRDYDRAVAYAFCYLESDKTQKIYAHMGADGSPKVWVNNQLVYEKWEDFSKAKSNYYNFEFEVKPGKNRLLLKIDNTESWWGFSLLLNTYEQEKEWLNKVTPAISVFNFSLSSSQISFVPEIRPSIPAFPIHCDLTSFEGDLLSEKTANAGQKVEFEFSENYNGPAKLVLNSGEEEPNAKAQHITWYGDMSMAFQDLNNRYQKAKLRYEKQLTPRMQPIYERLFLFCDRFLRMKFDNPGIDVALNYRYIERLINYMDKNRDIISEHPEEAFPILFSNCIGYEQDGFTTWARLSVPSAYAESSEPFPIVFQLHGSGRFGKEISHWPKANATIDATGDPVIVIRPTAYKSSDHLQRNYWDPVFLDDFYAKCRKMFDVDEERVYVVGGSGGAKGTWNWINQSTEKFAAAILLVGNEGYPFRAEKLRYLSMWIINGDLDKASYPFLPEVTISRLHSIGSEAIYTNFPGLGHRVSGGYNKAELKKWLLAHRNPHRVGQDPLFDMSIGKDGYSISTIKYLPARRYLGLTDKENPLYPQDNPYRASMKLYQAYRKPNSEVTERLAEGYCTIHEQDYLLEDGKEIMLITSADDNGSNGDLRFLDFGNKKVASFYVRCENSWDSLHDIKENLFKQLIDQGYQPTKEVFNTMLTISDAKDRYWEVCFVLRK